MPVVTIRDMPFIQLTNRAQLTTVAADVAQGLRTDDMDAVARSLDTLPDLDALGVRDAVLGTRELSTRPWTRTPPTPTDARAGVITSDPGYVPREFVRELNSRGVRTTTTMAAGAPRADVPTGQLAMVVNRRHMHAVQDLLDRGTTIANPYAIETNSKTHMAEAWSREGVEFPRTITRLADDDEVAAAFEQLGGDVMLKRPISAHGTHVLPARTVDEAIRASRRVRPERVRDSADHPLMQVRADIGDADVRLHFGRDWKTGVLHPIGAVERASTGTSHLTNLSAGGAARPIYDLEGGDPALPLAAIESARRAGDAMGLDWFSADVATDLTTGRPVLFEVDTAFMPLESHFPVPRDHQTFRHVADLLLHGDNATMQAARGASLRPGA